MDKEFERIFEIIEKEQIPDINLYIDQITTFMEEMLKSTKRGENDKIITKTMVNNYTKDRILPPPERKKYSPGQLMLLIMIYHLKPVLSINDIGRVLNSEYVKGSDMKILYPLFTEIQKNESQKLKSDFECLEKIIEELIDGKEIEVNDEIKHLMAVLFLSVEASYKKALAESLIDKYFREKKGKVN